MFGKHSFSLDSTGNQLRTLSIISGTLVALLALGAFILSFDALRHLAQDNNVPKALTWVWPLILDGSIVVFSLEAFRSSLRWESVRYPMTLVVTVTCVSVVFNILHAPPTFTGKLVAAFPPLLLFASFELLLRHLRSEVERQGRLESLADLDNLVLARESKLSRLDREIDRLADKRAAMKNEISADRSASDQLLLDRANTVRAGKVARRKAQIAQLHEQGLSRKQIAAEVGCSEKTVVRHLSSVRAA